MQEFYLFGFDDQGIGKNDCCCFGCVQCEGDDWQMCLVQIDEIVIYDILVE